MRKRPTNDLRYFTSFTASANEAGKNQNIRVIIIVLFVFLGAFITLTLIQVVRRKACRSVIKTKGRVFYTRLTTIILLYHNNLIPKTHNIIKIYLNVFKRQLLLFPPSSSLTKCICYIFWG